MLFSVYQFSATQKAGKHLDLVFTRSCPSPPVTVTLLHFGNVLSQSHTLSHSSPALSLQSHERISHALLISSTITSLLFYDCVGLWFIQGLWIVTALVLPKTYSLTHSNVSIFCLYCKNEVVMSDSLLECMC